MPDADNGINYTPDFATPDQIAAQRAYSKALLQQSVQGAPTGYSGNVTAVSPWGVGAGMAQALFGGLGMSNAADKERGLIGNAASAVAGRVPPGSSSSAAPGDNPYAANTSNDVQTSNYGAATVGMEGTNGNYAAVGPTTTTGDHAYGKYQVLGTNIPQWTQEALGTPLTPAQFLANPQAQEAVYKLKMGQYAGQYGTEGAGRAWYGGPQNVNNPNARDLANPNAPTVGQYGQRFAQLASNAPGLPQGAVAPPQAPGSPAVMAQALSARGPQMQPGAPSMGVPTTTAPNSPPGGQPINPYLVPQRPQVTKQQLEHIMANPLVPEGIKAETYQSWLSQNQPQQLTGPFGSTVLIGGGQNQGQQQVIPGAGEWGTSQVGTIQHPQYNAIIPPGYNGPAPGMFTANPVGGGGGAPQPAAQPTTSPIKPPDLIPPAEPEPAKTPGKSGSLEGMPKYASLETGTMTDASPAGPLGTPPPAMGVAKGEEPGMSGTTAAPAGVQTAQNADLDSMNDAQKYQWLQQQEISKGKAEAFNTKDAENYFTQLKGYQDSGTNAQNLETYLQLAQNVVGDPRFIQGPLADPRIAINTAMAAFGDKSAIATKTLNDVFDKNIATGILADMRGKLAGLGQVRIAEIDLLKQAMASKHNTMGANQAILSLAIGAQKQLQDLAQIADSYDKGVRWDKSGHPITDAQGNAVLTPQDRSSAGLNDVVNTYLSHHHLATPDEIKKYSTMLAGDNKPAEQPRVNLQQGGFSRSPTPAPAQPQAPQ